MKNTSLSWNGSMFKPCEMFLNKRLAYKTPNINTYLSILRIGVVEVKAIYYPDAPIQKSPAPLSFISCK